MNKPLTIDPAVLKRLQDLSRSERVACFEALWELCETFGKPHVHSGVSIRKLGGKLFECRVNLALRFIFQDRPADLYVSFLGNHDEVQALLRTGKYR
ncbi:MAG TPA: hypothetical protein VK615_17135 [Candidatus Binatia bacterium]|nr:hypothetical protein [Candidatus Binatia bacterium]